MLILSFYTADRKLKIDIGKTDPRDGMVSYVYYIGQCFELRRTSDSLNEGLPIKMTRVKFQRK